MVMEVGPDCVAPFTSGLSATEMALAMAASKLATSAAPSHGLPSWNRSPSLSVTVHLVKPSLGTSDLARYGTMAPVAVTAINGS